MLFDVSLIAVVGYLTPGYDPFTRYISELGAPNNPYSSLINVWWSVYSFFILVFSIGLYTGIARSRWSWVGPLVIAAEALANGILSGVFSCDIGCSGGSFSNDMHRIVSGTGTFISVFIPGLLLLSIMNDGRWKRMRSFLVTMQVVMISVAIYPFYGEYILMVHGTTYRYVGFFHRLYTVAYYISVITPALHLYSLSKASRSRKDLP